MVRDLRSLGFVCADDGHIAEAALSSSFIENKAALLVQLLIQDEVLHLLSGRKKRKVH